MHEIVKKYLDDKKRAERERYEQEKQNNLIALGLYEKVYSSDNKYSKEFSLTEWDDDNNKNRYFKKVPIELTDEEYQEVMKYSEKEYATEKNPVAAALTVIAWCIFIGGLIAGIAMGNVEVEKGYYYKYTTTEFSFAVAFVYWCASLISGTIFLGFAEIIKLLDAIRRK